MEAQLISTSQRLPTPGEEEPEQRAFTAWAKEKWQLALTGPTCLLLHLFLLSIASAKKRELQQQQQQSSSEM